MTLELTDLPDELITAEERRSITGIEGGFWIEVDHKDRDCSAHDATVVVRHGEFDVVRAVVAVDVIHVQAPGA